MQTVMGASPVAKLVTCCGTLSSRMRKLPLGMLGMKRPLLSSTATSTLTTLVSTLKSGCSRDIELVFPRQLGRNLGLLDFDRIAACLRGLATVSPTSLLGPS